MPDFQINIKTALQDAGIKATDEQIERLNQNLKIGNTAVADLGTEFEKTGEHGKEAHEKIHEGAAKVELKEREVRESVSAVAAQFGGLADVGLWLNPMTAALAAVLFLVEKFKEKINEATEAASRLAEQSEAIDAAKLKAFAESANSAAEAMQQLDIEQGKLDAAYARGDSAMDNRIKNYGAEKDALLQVEEAKEQAFEAEIRRQEALGKIGKETGDSAIAQAKLQLDSQRGASDESKLQDEITERKKQLSQAQGNLQSGKDQKAIRAAESAEAPLASKAAASDEAAKAAAGGKFQQTYTDRLGGELNFSGTVEDLKKQIQGQRQTQQAAEEQGDTVMVEQYKHNADALQDILNRQQTYIANLQKIAELDKQKVTDAKAHTEATIDQYRHDTEQDRSGQDRIDQLQKQLDLEKRTHAQVQALHQTTANANAQTEGIDALQRVQSGHGTPQEIADAQSRATQAAAAGERGNQANIDAANVLTKTQLLASSLRGTSVANQAPHLEEMNHLLDVIIGFVQNDSVTRSMHAALQSKANDLQRAIDELRSQVLNNRRL
jgi:hypothetical protein